jgi:hypothetical protein
VLRPMLRDGHTIPGSTQVLERELCRRWSSRFGLVR